MKVVIVGGVDVLLTDEATLHADMLVLAIGVTPDTTLASIRSGRLDFSDGFCQ